MYTHTNPSRTVRKNFTMPKETWQELEFLAEVSDKKYSQIIQELIHKESMARRNALRLQKLKAMKGFFTGQLSDGQTIQSMKSERDL